MSAHDVYAEIIEQVIANRTYEDLVLPPHSLGVFGSDLVLTLDGADVFERLADKISAINEGATGRVELRLRVPVRIPSSA